MAGTRSRQELNLVSKIKAFQEECGGQPITIRFSNYQVGSSSGQLTSVSNFYENPQGDKSAADVISNGAGGKYSISCKQYNPGNFCGQGLKSFSKENKVMNMWMNHVLGKVAAYYKKMSDDALEEATDYLIQVVRNTPANNLLTSGQRKKIEKQFEKVLGLTFPNLYIPIPSGMKTALFKCEDIYTGESVTHYITGGLAGNPDEDIENKTITFKDCTLRTIDEIVSDSGPIFVVIRKRRRDQFLDIVDSKGSPVKDSRKFMSIYGSSSLGGSGRRVQIRAHKQLPTKLRNNLFLDNGQKTTRASRTSGSDILNIPLSDVLNSIASAKYNNK